MNIYTVTVPERFMNIAVSKTNYLNADTNDSANWETFRVKLPKGPWRYHSRVGKYVRLIK